MTDEPERNSEPEQNEDEEQGSARSAIILVAIIIIVAIFSTSYGLQTLQWIAAHQWARQNAWLYDTPKPIASSNASGATAATPAPSAGLTSDAKDKKAGAQPKSTELGEYGYQMNVPWASQMKENPSAGGAEFRFATGQVVIFGDPDAQLDTVHILRDTPGEQYLPYAPLFANGAIQTNYDLYQAAYSASPSQVTPFTNYATAQRDRLLLLMKLSFGFDLAKPIYSFDFGRNRGFQFGDPASGPVAVHVFDPHDKHLRFIFTVASGSGGQITQADINQAVQSLLPVEATYGKGQ
ncbi:MAG TPA: hypothetical protein VJS43_19895 [Candidatus Acidoferrales bacterium]|nr:hypothetical protein [Candidatus Acidoferrales bacterium]